MSLKNAAIATGIVVSAMTALVTLSPSTQTTAAVMEPTGSTVAALDVQGQRDAAAAEAARESAEASRAQVPAVLAARAEAQRIAEEQARAEAARIAAEEEAARRAAQAEADRAAAEAKAAKERAARERAAQERAAQEAAAAQAATAPAPPPAPAPAPPPAAAPTGDRGIGASAYTGPLYNAAHEATRQCIVRKESGGNYGVVSRNGLYFGAYQFSRPTGDATARRMGRGDLVGVPVNTWSRAEQDQAFWTLWNNGAGRGNWPTAAGC